MIKVYFETDIHAKLAATFTDEVVYIACLPTLEKVAKQNRMRVTESVD